MQAIAVPTHARARTLGLLVTGGRKPEKNRETIKNNQTRTDEHKPAAPYTIGTVELSPERMP